VTAARALLQDKRPAYRYADADLVTYVSDAVAEARRLRPDFFLYTARRSLTFYTTANMDTAVPLPDMYFPQVVNYVAGRGELRDDTFTNDGRAVALTTAWALALSGGSRT
jgi:hypothetical protein